jgi:hypothetical protein
MRPLCPADVAQPLLVHHENRRVLAGWRAGFCTPPKSPEAPVRPAAWCAGPRSLDLASQCIYITAMICVRVGSRSARGAINVKARRGGCLPHLAGTQCQAANRAVPPAPVMRRGAARVLSLLLASTLGSPFARRAPLQWCSNAQHQTARGLPPGRAGAPPPQQQQQQYHTDRLPWKTLSPLPHHLYPSALDNGADEDRRTAETSSGPLGMRAEFWSEDWQRRPVVRALRRLLLSILTLPVYKPACMPVSSGASYIRTIPARLISSS